MSKKNVLVVCLIVILIVVGVFFAVTGLFSAKPTTTNFSAWVVYWDVENAKTELDSLKSGLNSVSLFSAYYDNENKLVMPESLTKIAPDIKTFCTDNQIKYYLTVVNDKIDTNDKSSLKDQQLLKAILSDEKSRQSAIADIIQLTKTGGYDGIEIDYEAIKENNELWDNFIAFIKELYVSTQQDDIALSIILEPSAPVGTMEFPKGPTYIMMAYNLHGANDEPGAKADKALIRKLAEKMKSIQSEKRLAFASGGYNWVDGGKTTAVTEMQAKQLMLDYNVKADRDSTSGALTFKYSDGTGHAHTVWFADGNTLKLWLACAKEAGFSKFALWRIGGNSPATLLDISAN